MLIEDGSVALSVDEPGPVLAPLDRRPVRVRVGRARRATIGGGPLRANADGAEGLGAIKRRGRLHDRAGPRERERPEMPEAGGRSAPTRVSRSRDVAQVLCVMGEPDTATVSRARREARAPT
jgi:hypothetical protein